MAEIPAGHAGGVIAFAVTVTGVETELPFGGAVTVMTPFDVEAKAHEASRNKVKEIDFIKAQPGKRFLMSYSGRRCTLRDHDDRSWLWTDWIIDKEGISEKLSKATASSSQNHGAY